MPIIPKYTIPASQFASTEETLGGTSDNKAVTPRGLNAALRYMGLLQDPVYDSVYIRIDATNMPIRGDTDIRGALRLPENNYIYFGNTGHILSTPGDVYELEVAKRDNGSGIENAKVRIRAIHLGGNAAKFEIYADSDTTRAEIDSFLRVYSLAACVSSVPAAGDIIADGNMNVSSGHTYNINGIPHTHAGGSGDVVGPPAAAIGVIPVYATTSGKSIWTSGATISTSGAINIPAGQTYNIGGSAHAHSYGVGDVIGPSIVTSGMVAVFATTTGKAIVHRPLTANSIGDLVVGNIGQMLGLNVSPTTASVPLGDAWMQGDIRAKGGFALDPTNTTDPAACVTLIMPNDQLNAGLTQGLAGAIVQAPKYTGISSLRTVTRHNYQVYQNLQATLSTATEVVSMYFDERAGFHRCIDTGITPGTTQKVKASMNTVQAWLKVQIGSSLGYIPVYMNKFS